MSEFQIITDGAADLGAEFAKEIGVDVVPFYVSFDDTNYKKEITQIAVRDFYQQMLDAPKVFPKSSMPSVQDFADAFTPYVKQGVPVICICITTKFSGSYNSAMTAAGMLKDSFPDAKITVIDSTMVTVLQGIFVREAVRMQCAGVSYEDTVTRLLGLRESGRIFFTIGGMSYLVHGGRVGKLMGLAANTLNIRPIITMKEGEIFSSGIARSRKKSIEKVIELVKAHLKEAGADAAAYELVVGYGYDKDEAQAFRDQLRASVSAYMDCGQIDIYQIGATIGVHTGPYPLGVGLLKKYVCD